MKTYYPSLILLIIFLTGCSSSKLVKEYKNPETYTFEVNKVLIIGMTANIEVRRNFEKNVADALEHKNIIAAKSVDFFEKSFTNRKQTVEELNTLESLLLEAGFDAILLTKVTGQQTRVSIVDFYSNLESEKYKRFNDYYYGNQDSFLSEDQEEYVVYITETSLYCICPEKERELLWQGNIEVTKSISNKKNINDFTKTLLKSLKDNDLLL